MTEMNLKIVQEKLIGFYSSYIDNNVSDTMKEDMLSFYSAYENAMMIPEPISRGLARLFDIAVKTNAPVPTKEEAERIIENLRKLEL